MNCYGAYIVHCEMYNDINLYLYEYIKLEYRSEIKELSVKRHALEEHVYELLNEYQLGLE